MPVLLWLDCSTVSSRQTPQRCRRTVVRCLGHPWITALARLDTSSPEGIKKFLLLLALASALLVDDGFCYSIEQVCLNQVATV
jgi:hypothetical protein